MSLARSGPVVFCWGRVWRASRGQLVVCRDICIVRDDELLSFVVNSRVPFLLAILRVFFAKIASFFNLDPQTIVFLLQMFGVILQFPHMFCLLFMFLLYVLTPMKKLILRRLDHLVAGHCTYVGRVRCGGYGNRWSYWWRRAVG